MLCIHGLPHEQYISLSVKVNVETHEIYIELLIYDGNILSDL